MYLTLMNIFLFTVFTWFMTYRYVANLSPCSFHLIGWSSTSHSSGLTFSSHSVCVSKILQPGNTIGWKCDLKCPVVIPIQLLA